MVASIWVKQVDDDGYSVGKGGRAEVEIPEDVLLLMAEEVIPGQKQTKRKTRDAVATGIETLVRVWVDFYQRGKLISNYEWWKNLPFVGKFAKRLTSSMNDI